MHKVTNYLLKYKVFIDISAMIAQFVEGLTFNVSSFKFQVSGYISRKGRRERRKTLKVEYSLLLTLALEGSQLHATEGAEVDERKTERYKRLTFNFIPPPPSVQCFV